MSGIDEAKKRLVLNVGSNFAYIAVSSVLSLWLTPYLIDNLGLALYGLIPLCLSISHYFEFVNAALSSSISRFITLFVNKEDYQTASSYYTTSICMLVVVSVFMVLPAILGAVFLPKYLSVPLGYEFEFGILLFVILVSVFVTTISSPFMVSSFACHRFDLQNLIKIFGKVLYVAIIVMAFTFISKRIIHVGIATFVMSGFTLIFSCLVTQKLLPKLNFTFSSFDKHKIKDLTTMGTWMVVAQMGALLYLNIDMVIINIFLGSKEVGKYAPFVQWVTLVAMFSGSISSVFAPMAMEYIAQKQDDLLIIQTKRILKLLGLILAFPVGILCGLSKPLLIQWLDKDFGNLYGLMWLLLAPAMINSVMSPLHGISRGLNKVKVPAIMTLIGGGLNLVLSILFVKLTPLGIYGVALATFISRVSKNFIFMPLYIAKSLRCRLFILTPSFFPGFVFFSLNAGLCYMVSRYYDLDTILKLGIAAFVSMFIFAPFCYFLGFNRDDRRMVLGLINPLKNKL